MQLCGYATMRKCGYAIMRLCDYAIMRLCDYAIMRLCEYAIMGPGALEKMSSDRAPGRAAEAPRDICGKILGTLKFRGDPGSPATTETGETV